MNKELKLLAGLCIVSISGLLAFEIPKSAEKSRFLCMRKMDRNFRRSWRVPSGIEGLAASPRDGTTVRSLRPVPFEAMKVKNQLKIGEFKCIFPS